MGRIEWDTSQVDRLAADLSKAPNRIQRRVPKVLEVAANKIKRTMKDGASGHAHLPYLDRHVSYDKITPFHYEIGFDKVGQGNLANIAAFGSVNNDPVMAPPGSHLRRELPSIMRHLGEAGEECVFGGSE